MDRIDPAALAEWQKAWFKTGRSLEQWIGIARACPRERNRARLHGEARLADADDVARPVPRRAWDAS